MTLIALGRKNVVYGWLVAELRRICLVGEVETEERQYDKWLEERGPSTNLVANARFGSP